MSKKSRAGQKRHKKELKRRTAKKKVRAREVGRRKDGSRSIPLGKKGKALIDAQFRAFERKFGRPPGPDDPIFFDPSKDVPAPYPEDFAKKVVEEQVAIGMSVGLDPRLLYAVYKTDGLMLTEENERLMPADDLEEWYDAIEDWDNMSLEQQAKWYDKFEEFEKNLPEPKKDPSEKFFTDEEKDLIMDMSPNNLGSTYCPGCARPVDEDEDLCWLCENQETWPEGDEYINPYAGESDAKRLARVHLYQRAADYFEHMGDPGGWALVLAGPDAAECGALRYILEWPRDRTIFVDLDTQGLEIAKVKWPGVDAFYGNIIDILSALEGGIGFAHFDFMGHVNKTVQETFSLAREKVNRNGIVAYTYLRGREQKTQEGWVTAQKIGKYLSTRDMSLAEKKAFRQDDQAQRDSARTLGYIGLMASALSPQGLNDYHPIYMSEYHSGKSPMSVFALANTPIRQRTAVWNRECSEFLQTPKFDSTKSPLAVKHLADALRAGGIPVKQVADVLNVPKGTINAWRAHLTMGTYDE